MLLSRPEILAALEAGDIIIDPFDERNLGTASYDVTVGPHIYREAGSITTVPIGCSHVAEMSPHIVANPYSEHGVSGYEGLWQRDRAEACGRDDLMHRLGFRSSPQPGIHDGDEIILLAPQELILAHTIEFIGSTSGIGVELTHTTQMHSRSTTVRMGLDVCGSGGWGDHGFCNRWTMEIRNNFRFHHMPLIVGRRIAQINFFRTEPIRDGADYSAGGKYCDGAIEEMKANWTPDRMLPLAHRDRETNDPSYQKIVASLFGSDRPNDT